MAQVRRGDRKRIYDQFVGGIANSVPLPSIAAFSPTIPPCIVSVVDELYKSMAAIDYRVREQDFDLTFLRISRALLILRNQEKIRQWRQKRQKQRAAAAEKQLRLVAVLKIRRNKAE